MSESAREVTRTKRFLDKELQDIKSLNFWRGVFGEYIGTLVLCQWSIGIGLHLPDDDSPPDILTVAVGTGFLVAGLINSLANVSGGHVNPAISIGFLIRGKITVLRFIFYVIVQCLACLSAVGILSQLIPPNMQGFPGLLFPAQGVTEFQAFGLEFFITFLLLFATAAFLDSRRPDNTLPVPLFVGLVVATNILFAARTSGGCMNPARNFGPAVVSGVTKTQWVYWLGPLLGGAAGTLVYDRLLSAKAMSGPICVTCLREKSPNSDSRENSEASTSENERDRMLTTQENSAR